MRDLRPGHLDPVGVDGNPFPEDCLMGRDWMRAKGLTASEVRVYAPRKPTTAAPVKWQAAVVIGALVILLAMYAARSDSASMRP